MIGQTLGHYRVLELLGKGGMGEVYRAEDTTLGREVAIKVLPQAFTEDPERLARFEREAKLLATLNHPYIAQIHALEEVDGQRLLVMELVEGETLAERLSRGSLPVEDALPIALQITQALEAAHERGIIHRDLKPANIKITPGGEVKVLDFGLAKPITDATSGDLSHSPTLTYSPTRAGVLLGTASYMSPEQARGQEVDRRTDIWSFGVVLWEMLTGKHLFDGETVSDILAGVLKEEPEWNLLPPDLCRPIQRVLHRCLTRDPKERLHDIADARLEIEEAIASPLAESSGPGSASATQSLWSRLSTVWWALLLCLLLGAGIYGLVGRIVSGSPESVPGSPQAERRTAITLPEGIEFGLSYGVPTLAASPDGRWLVFVGDQDGKSRLFKRSFARFEVTPIPGTDGARRPFFSPDGRFVAYFDMRERKLKKVDLNGSQPIVLCDVDNPFGGTWGPNGTIVFNPGTYSGLWQIAEGGGQPEPLLLPHPEDGITDYYEPSFLPGGEAILFTAWRGGFTGLADHVGIFDPASGETKALLESAVAPRYLRSGHLVFGRGSHVEVAPFDPQTQDLTGPTVPVPEPIAVHEVWSIPGLTVFGDGTLAYVPSSEQEQRSLVIVDLLGNEQLIPGARRGFQRSRFSPDGESVAVSVVESGESSIWVVNPATGAQTKLAGEGEKMFPEWSPDGEHIAFAMTSDDPAASWSIYWQPVHGVGPPEPLVMAREPGETLWPYAWTPGGKTLVFGRLLAEGRAAGNTNIGYKTTEPEGEAQLFSVSEGADEMAVLSPDGLWLAYRSDHTGSPHLYVQRFPEGAERHQVSVEQIAAVIGWSADGRELYFTVERPAGEEAVMVATIAREPRFAAEVPRELLRRTMAGAVWTMARYEDLAPDGSHFIVVKSAEASPFAREIRLISNWFEELERLAPTSEK